MFPKEKMSHTSSYEGNKSEEGWLVLNIGNVELEGVQKIYIDLGDIKDVKARAEKGLDALEEAKRLLGAE